MCLFVHKVLSSLAIVTLIFNLDILFGNYRHYSALGFHLSTFRTVIYGIIILISFVIGTRVAQINHALLQFIVVIIVIFIICSLTHLLRLSTKQFGFCCTRDRRVAIMGISDWHSCIWVDIFVIQNKFLLFLNLNIFRFLSCCHLWVRI